MPAKKDGLDMAHLRVGIEVDGAQKFKNELQTLNRESRVYDTTLKRLKGSLDGAEHSLDDLQEMSDVTGKKFESQKKKVELLKQEYERLAKENGRNSKEAQNMLIRYNKTAAQMRKTELQLEAVNKQIADQTNTYKQVAAAADKAVSDINTDLKALEAQHKANTGGVKDLAAENNHLAKVLEKQGQATEQLRRKYQALAADIGEDAAETRKAMIAYNESIGSYKRVEQALNGVQEELAKQDDAFAKASQEAKRATDEIADDLRVLESEFKKARSSVGELAEAEEELYSESQRLQKVLELEGKAVEALNKKYQAAVREKGQDAKATKDAQVELNNAIAKMNKTEKALRDLDNEIDDSIGQWKLFGRTVKVNSEALEEAKTHASELGKGMGVAIGTGAALAGVGLVKMANDAQSSTKTLQAQLGLTAAEADKVGKTARKVWKDGFGENVDEVNEAVFQVKQNIKGLNDTDLEKVTKNSMTLAKLYNTDVNEVTRAANSLMQNYGLTAEEAFDKLAKGAQKGMNFSNEMFDNMSEYTINFKEAGFSAQEMFNILQNGAKKGYNLDRLNDSVLEFKLQSEDSGKAYVNAMKDMDENTQKVFKQYQNGKATVADLYKAVVSGLKDMKGTIPEKDFNVIGKALFGTKFEDQGADVILSMQTVNKEMENTKGSMDGMRKNAETAGQRFKSMIREFMDAAAPLGHTLLDIGERWMPKIEKAVQFVADKFDNMNPKLQSTVVIGGLLVAAAIPLIAMFGGIAAAIGPLLPLLGGGAGIAGMAGVAAGGAGLLTGALGAILGPATAVIGVAAAIGVGMYGLHKAMDQPIMKSKIFGDEISKSTQKALKGYMDLDNNARNSLNQLAWGQQKITGDMATNLLGQYDKLFSNLNSKIDKNHSDQMSKARKLFADNAGLTASEEQKILANMEKNNEAKKKKVQGYEDRIKEIINTAKKEHRTIRESEQKEINDIQNRMREEAVKTISKSAAEQKKILGTLKHESSKLTAEQAAAVVKNSKTQRDKSVENAQSQYKKSVEQIRYMRDVTGELTDEQAKRAIKNAKKQRDDSVDAANDMHKKVVKAAKEQAKGHADEIDWERGEVKDGYDKMKEYVDKFVSWAKGLFGVKSSKKTSTAGNKPVSKTLKNNGQGRATGTPNGAIPTDQVALTGEEGPELYKDGRTGALSLLGANGPEYSYLSKGSAILPAHHTAKVFKKYGFKNGIEGLPAYAGGADIDVFDYLLKGPEKLWDFAASKFNIGDNLIPSWLTNMTGSVTDFVGNQATTWLKSLMDNFGFGEGGAAPNIKGGAAAWRPIIMKAAAAMRESVTAAEVNGIIAQIQRESGGNQKIIQSSAVRDINTRNGNPARGLLQYIPQTFNAYKVKGHGNIYSGYDQLLAFFNNTSWRKNLPYGRRGWGPTGKRKYATGGKVDSHQLAELGENGYDEYVITTEPRYRNRSLALLQSLMKDLGVYNPIPKVKIDENSFSKGKETKTTEQPIIIQNTFQVSYSGMPDKESVMNFMKYMKEIANEQEEQQLRSRGIRRSAFQ
jgi:phage-related minor tail protein/SLT domain-containing protein